MKLTIRLLLGSLFILSALMKLAGMDGFELFVFKSFGLSWTLTCLLSRMVISLELGIGIFYIIGLWLRKINLIAAAVLCILSLWLAYQMLSGNTENCHCFGELISFSPLHSLIKNLVMLFLMLVLLKLKKPSVIFLPHRFRTLVITSSILVIFLVPIIISPPDFLFPGRYTVDGNARKLDFRQLENTPWINSKASIDIENGRVIVMFMSIHCSMCQKAARKATIINNRQGGKLPMYYVFVGNKKDMNEFWNKTDSYRFPYKIISAELFLSITKKLPTIFFLNNGKIENIFGYRNFDEQVVKSFLD